MNILAIDSAQAACSAAILKHAGGDQAEIVREFEWRPRGHAEVLADMIARIMARAEISFKEIDRIGVTIGPGNFTGLRVGLAAARGLALAANIEIVGISTLEAVAANIPERDRVKPIGVFFDARRGEIYGQIFSTKLEPMTEPLVFKPEAVLEYLPDQAIIAIGSGTGLILEMLGKQAGRLEPSSALNAPDAAIIAQLAVLREPDEYPPEPLYLRAPDAKPQKKSTIIANS